MEKRNHKISLQQKKEFASEFKTKRTFSEEMPFMFRFDNEQVKELVELEGAVEFRITKGLEKGKENVCLTVVDDKGEDLEFALEMSEPCPPDCP